MTRLFVKITKRDCDLLSDVYKHRFLSISQIERLHFPSLQTAYRRMRVLREAKLVSAFSVANINEAIFMIASRGLDVLADIYGVEREQLKWHDAPSKPRDYYFMRHFLSINDFRITLRFACEDAGIRLLGFIPDYYGERSDDGVASKYIRDIVLDMSPPHRQVSHTPDGVFALETKGKFALFCLEVDRGTEVLSDPGTGVLKALSFYASYLIDGKYQRYAEEFKVEEFKGFRVLFLTTTDERIRKIRAACERLDVPAKAKQCLWMATSDSIDEKSLFRTKWQSADSSDQTRYQIIKH